MTNTGMKKVDFTKVKIYGINGEEIPLQIAEEDDKGNLKTKETSVCETLGNTLFIQAKTIPLAEIAKRIYNKEEVELRDEDIAEIKEVINGRYFQFAPMVKRQVIDFIDKA